MACAGAAADPGYRYDAADLPDGGGAVEEHLVDLDRVAEPSIKTCAAGMVSGSSVAIAVSSARVELCEALAEPTITRSPVMIRPVCRFGVDNTRTPASRNRARAVGEVA
ncbi:MAG: hypothetical protein WAX14_05000, partial [Rhodococcus sp. (in: high G+C Gram-positive bacteria)]|uniref:hypothetical protein n=1 Tax=Rhodococcus sp. TaxID=1831 RepID=UPI003BB6E2FD